MPADTHRPDAMAIAFAGRAHVGLRTTDVEHLAGTRQEFS
jgi:hypothetical protein